MLIVGGTYREVVREPHDRRIGGSGLRAAASLQLLSPNSVLVSAVEDGLKDAADSTAAALGIAARWMARTGPIIFVYRTPVSSATKVGEASIVEQPGDLEAEAALVFGQVEGNVFPNAHTLVVDPQYSIGLEEIRAQSAERLAIVANLHETRELTRAKDARAAGRQLLRRSGADVVVTKMAARGLIVTTADAQTVLGPCPAPSVWPVGSGDVFSAAFACGWGERGMSPVTAAASASMATSIYCRTRRPRLPADLFERAPALAPVQLGRRAQVYLAGPFFTIAERWFVSLVHDALQDLGAEVFSPLHDVGLGGREVAAADLKGLRRSQSVLALLEHRDVGTAFEAGWATHGNKPVVVYVEGPADNEGMKMLEGSGARIHRDLASAIYWAVWRAMGIQPSP